MAEKKITKKDFYELTIEIVAASDAEKKDEVVEFLQKQIELLENKAEKAKERAAKAKEKSDELKDAVFAVLTTEYQTADEILAQVAAEDITKAKVVARLTALVKEELAVKEQAKIDSKRIMTYKLA